MKYQKHFCLFVVLILLVLLVGCDGTSSAIQLKEDDTVYVDRDDVGFEEVITFQYSDGESYTYFREVATDVLYVWRDSGAHYGKAGFAAMMDPQTGGPLTYENWVMYLKEKNAVPTCSSCGAACTTDFCGSCGTPTNSED